MVAEGGTEYGHMVTYARSKDPYGPFEAYAQNPVLTNRNLGGNENHIQGIGHGDLIETPYRETFMVCLGFRIQSDWMPFHHLGREVFLVPVTWDKNGWFTAGVDGTVQTVMDLPLKTSEQKINGRYDVSFETIKNEPQRFCHLREYHPECYEFTENSVTLFGNRFTLNDTESPTFLGVRQSEFDTELTVSLTGNSPEAGITFYLSEEHHYDLAVLCKEKKRTLILRLRIGDAVMTAKEIELPEDAQIILKVVSDAAQYHFYGFINEEEILLGSARTKYLSSEVAGGFTGVVMGMYAVNPNEDQKQKAQFTNLYWKQGTDR